MTANVSIIIAHRDNVLQIKNAALRYRPPDATPVETKQNMPGRGGRGSGSGDAGVSQRRAERTVYVLPNFASRPRPVQIKTGISDGIMTEVVKGLKEGDRAVTAELTSATAAPSPHTNPLA